MKKIIVTIAFLFSLHAHAGTLVFGPRVSTGGGGGPTLLINQGAEGTGYDNGPEIWIETIGNPNEDYTPALVGGQSILMSGTNVRLDSPTFTAQDEVWTKFVWNPSTLPAERITIFWFRSAGGNLVGVDINTDGTIRVGGSANSGNTTASITLNSDNWFRVHYIKGTGMNATYSVEFNTSDSFTGTASARFTSINSGTTETAQIDQIRLQAEGSTTVTFVLDNIQVAGGSTPMP